ncbi:2-oxo-4-hydroxy-4-carboxy-5-ureidoimidazoline decarboxylase [Klebsiella michiganensis]|uniref:2-oxo-4-hydroxy-4-carboxy-5-ureidoimidazoline decarboxylase n=1 Tax=Klebsiella michiganensis TaxID=1134687 RepID=UPI0018C50958|nr:2-oxo-4-hydroxy-4-carboxy-5-ureidoimidazoline decarboxylase [Klebsiella michiganensis]MBG2642896.1 2-oxo-4-hydroxy-4-carboxy-5-ureidoimidazoline decarboxylase [Klebsiella michiganensis]
MIALNHFNQLSGEHAVAVLEPCGAISGWAAALAAGRPWRSRADLLSAARRLMAAWGEAELTEALSAHPRIGEKSAGSQAHAALSRQEQGSVDDRDAALAQALKEGNARYEARFGRVFLIRAKGRSGDEILAALSRRLQNSERAEVEDALAQLREITLLRLEGAIGE